MSSLTTEELEQLSSQIQQQLSSTPYACSLLTPIHGGSANFIYRGTLVTPLASGGNKDSNEVCLSDGATPELYKTVIVKHTAGFLSVSRDFKIDVSRCLFEETMLYALESFPAAHSPTTQTTTVIKTPRLYHFDRTTNTQIHQDFPNALDMKTLLLSDTPLSHDTARSIGHDLGVWLRAFHDWTAAPGQEHLCDEIAANTPMRQLKYDVTYGSKGFFDVLLTRCPDLLEGGVGEMLLAAGKVVEEEFKGNHFADVKDAWGVLHGDFWTGNVLLPNQTPRPATTPTPTDLVVIDWELAHVGHRSADIGQFIGDLYERYHYKGVSAALPAIEGFTAGYGAMSHHLAHRTAMYAGVHVITWARRGAPVADTEETMWEGMRMGRNLVHRGYMRDREWFLREGGVFGCLFRPF
ncbi:kinase-like domain-containing protein [Bombardia bombarda]|uniref:Kinase-like domain-containing protein n=1 Tax=Bombardia bombarda TaxID=252184 RepID=A0AA39TWI9_9PEZI|nr:kinase-like domain-containing protein [Bombardia bombarda]